MENKMKGIVVEIHPGSRDNPDNSGNLNPHSYEIRGEDGNIYFAHMGDIKSNTELLYSFSNQNIERLVNGDEVEFEPRNEGKRAINKVKKEL